MTWAETYRRQVALLIRMIPFIAKEECFALKGGTAINLFVRDMPRLSVDIDLTYLPVSDRASSLRKVTAAMKRIAANARRAIGAHVNEVQLKGEDCITKLIASLNGVQIKVEVTPVLRGCLYEPSVRRVSPRTEELFGHAEMQVVSFPDLYAGKIVAALDRQHPRDLFDIHGLLANEGISPELRTAFVIYLLSHNRPMAEVLAPARLDIAMEFKRGFSGMTEEPVSLETLLSVRETLIASIVGEMPDEHRRFLISFKSAEPDWQLLGVPKASRLPAVRWRADNLGMLSRAKRLALTKRLMEVLSVED